MTIFALDTSLEAISVVFLFGALLYGYKLSGFTKGARIVALAKPKTFFAAILVSFASLFVMQLISLVNELFIPLPYLQIISRALIIVTALSGVFGLYTALYYYRTVPKRAVAVAE